MDMQYVIAEDRALKEVGLELMFLTPEKCNNDDGITAVELSRHLGLNIDVVKKKLKILHEKGVVQVKGINPKLWKFNDYNFQRMPEDDEVYALLSNFEDVDFDKYFTY